MKNMRHIKLEGYQGKWTEIDRKSYGGTEFILLEHDTYGDETSCIIIDENKTIVLDDVWNGFSELEDLMVSRLDY